MIPLHRELAQISSGPTPTQLQSRLSEWGAQFPSPSSHPQRSPWLPPSWTWKSPVEYCSRGADRCPGICTVAGVGAGGTAREQGLSDRDEGDTGGQGGPPDLVCVREKGWGPALESGLYVGHLPGGGDSLSRPSAIKPSSTATASPAQEAAPSGPPGCSPAPPSNCPSTQTRPSPLDLQFAWTWAGPPLRQVNNATFISLCQ